MHRFSWQFIDSMHAQQTQRRKPSNSQQTHSTTFPSEKPSIGRKWLQGTLAGSFGLHCLVELDWMWNLGGEWGAANGGSME